MVSKLKELAAMAVVCVMIAVVSVVVISACVALLPVRWLIDWDSKREGMKHD